jgi:hypothetical protein
MRGRLIFPVWVTIARLDTAEIEADGGYDPDFSEVRREGSGVGSLMRRELPEIEILGQVEPDREEVQRLAPVGNVAETSIGIVFHLAGLERDGLYDPTTGELGFKVGDRLVRLRNRRKTRIIRLFDRVPVFCTQVRHLSAWLGGESNLILASYEERPEGLR